jgi:hypothetical protein
VTATRLSRQRRASGIAGVTTITAPTAPIRQPDVQGTLALDLDPVAPPDRRTTLSAVAGQRDQLERFTRRFCAVVIEVVTGDRGPAQLLRLVDESVYDDLVRRSRALAGVGGVDERLHRPRARIRSVRVFCPAPGVAEFGMHVQHGRRSRAVAGRLELRGNAWICVALEFG